MVSCHACGSHGCHRFPFEPAYRAQRLCRHMLNVVATFATTFDAHETYEVRWARCAAPAEPAPSFACTQSMIRAQRRTVHALAGDA